MMDALPSFKRRNSYRADRLRGNHVERLVFGMGDWTLAFGLFVKW